ncbi:hypothetical protein [Paractinoplanes rishiriensis]|uniref:Uncharacterized protein n=1 Tax=Paractinoplanes rishiriensis TaxID=1050105 RepID=A0A919JRZ9_9ACTN|nr:hypothetical protein [Actinoplanes rishiriensis]GIE93688.1 hypothetical protein Ari01nite_11530 [Actinoplanes rishiriensis]
MNLLKSKLRRATAVLAGSFLGVAGAVGIAASPASAHHPTLSGDAVCTTAAGDWKVTWTIGNSQSNLTATLIEVSVLAPQGGTVSGVKVGDTLPLAGTNLTATQELSASDTVAKLKVKAKWDYGTEGETEGSAWRKDSGKDGGKVSKIVVKEAELSVEKPSSEGCKKDEPEPGPSSPSPTPTETPGDESPEPEFAFESYCDGLLIKADTPADVELPDGVEELVLTVKSNQGETKELPITPGKKTEVFFDGVEGLSVEISYDGEVLDFGDIKWEPAAEECDGEGGGLPVTGAAAGGIAGGAAVLLGVGGLLFFLARRRKVQFTA